MVRDLLNKSLELDSLFYWLINFNPMMVQSGTQWDSKTIKEVVFCQNQQMVSSSGSSIAFSQHNMS